jgi:hypothetical protein
VAGQLAAQRSGLEERETRLAPAADVERSAGPGGGVSQLHLDQVDQVVDVDHVANLLALAAVADVRQRPLQVVAQHPMREDALVDLAHLPGPRDHAAAIDHRAHPEGLRVLGDQVLGRQLGGAVKRPPARERERLGHPRTGHTRELLLVLPLESRLALRPAR